MNPIETDRAALLTIMPAATLCGFCWHKRPPAAG
jgi:hypothetical protein